MKIEWKILKANADTERAQLNKVLADIAATISESAKATLAQANITATMATEEGLNGFASAWRETLARVSGIDGTITAIAQDVTALEARVDDVESGESGNATAIQNLTSRVDANEDGIAANSSAITQVAASGRMDVLDGSFEGDGWTGIPQFQVSKAAFDVRTGSYALRIGWGRGFTAIIQNNRTIPVEPTSRLTVGYWGAASGTFPSVGATVYLGLYYTDANGSVIDYQAAAFFICTANTPGGYQLYSQTVVVPPGAVNLRVDIIAQNWDDGWFHVDDVFATRLDGAGQQNAVATQLLQADVDSVAGKVNTSYTLAMNANGKFSGVKYGNDGSVSNAQFLFDNFDFITSDGSFQITGGRTITRSNGYMRVEGKPFGQNNEMVVWYGPEQTNLADCLRSNAISFETNTGIHYAKGAIFSGTITAGGQTLAVNATTYSTGPFGTNGGPITVNASFSHSRTRKAGMISSGNKNTMSKGGGSTGATLELWRSIDGGAMQLVASSPANGSMEVYNDIDPDIESRAEWSLTGSITYTDNVGGTANRNYQLQVKNITFQDVNISGPAMPPPATNSRALSVLTAE